MKSYAEYLQDVETEFTGIGRAGLLQEIARLRQQKGTTWLVDFPTSVILNALEDRGDCLIFKGWICRACGVFNGEEKHRRSDCRSCGLARQ